MPKICSARFPVCLQRNTERLGTAHPSTLQSEFGPLYHLFGPLKDNLRGHHYESDDAVQEAVGSWLRVAGTDF
jgi:hypothetical protein